MRTAANPTVEREWKLRFGIECQSILASRYPSLRCHWWLSYPQCLSPAQDQPIVAVRIGSHVAGIDASISADIVGDYLGLILFHDAERSEESNEKRKEIGGLVEVLSMANGGLYT